MTWKINVQSQLVDASILDKSFVSLSLSPLCKLRMEIEIVKYGIEILRGSTDLTFVKKYRKEILFMYKL